MGASGDKPRVAGDIGTVVEYGDGHVRCVTPDEMARRDRTHDDGSWFGMPEEVEGALLLKLSTAQMILAEMNDNGFREYAAEAAKFIRGERSDEPAPLLSNGLEIPMYVRALAMRVGLEVRT
jgi:hypothetical protein